MYSLGVLCLLSVALALPPPEKPVVKLPAQLPLSAIEEKKELHIKPKINEPIPPVHESPLIKPNTKDDAEKLEEHKKPAESAKQPKKEKELDHDELEHVNKEIGKPERKDSKEIQHSKESKHSKEIKSSKEATDSKEKIKESKEINDSKEFKHSKEAKDSKEESKEADVLVQKNINKPFLSSLASYLPFKLPNFSWPQFSWPDISWPNWSWPPFRPKSRDQQDKPVYIVKEYDLD